MKFLLDTDHIQFLLLGVGPEYAALSARMSRNSPADFAYSLVSFHEQALGWHAYITRARTTRNVVRGDDQFHHVFQTYSTAAVLPFDTAAATTFDGLAPRRLRVGVMDLRIASIALSRGMTVLTRNLGDFRRVPGLLAED